MAIERKTIPYEILIRFNFDPQVGELGIFRGAHYIESEAVVDTDTGEVISYKPGPALELPDTEAIRAYLGDQFAEVEKAYRLARAEADELASRSD